MHIHIYTRYDFVKDINHFLEENGYDVDRVANYIYQIYLDNHITASGDDQLYETVYLLMGMNAGPEFELNESEFRDIIGKLQYDCTADKP